MDYKVNGVEYLILDQDNNDQNNNCNNNSKEFNYTKQWLILNHNPTTQKQLDILDKKYELLLNELFYFMSYKPNYSNNSSNVINIISNKNTNTDIDTETSNNLKIPETYFRFKKLLDIDYEDI